MDSGRAPLKVGDDDDNDDGDDDDDKNNDDGKSEQRRNRTKQIISPFPSYQPTLFRQEFALERVSSLPK